MKRGRKRGVEADHSRLGRALSICFQVLLHGSLVMALAAAVYFLNIGYRMKQGEVARKELEVAHLQREISVLQDTNKDLRYSSEFLKTDDGIEKVAREKLDLVKPGEVTFQVISRPTPPARPKPIHGHPNAEERPPQAAPEGWIPDFIQRVTGDR